EKQPEVRPEIQRRFAPMITPHANCDHNGPKRPITITETGDHFQRNTHNETTINDIVSIYIESWKLGLKAVAVYRDGSKRTQPLSTSQKEQEATMPTAVRNRMPDERRSITHKFDIAGHKGYITAGIYDNGSLGEIFVTMAKQGSTISGLMDSFATAISMALQYGVPLEVLVDKFSHSRFEPSGVTCNPEIPLAKSIMDYIFRWLQLRFLDQDGDKDVAETEDSGYIAPAFTQEADAPACSVCGSIMFRSGACHGCLNCGSSSGCG
ncbi:MAG: hypothetical protein GY847_14010, partial [Proteobacteria bacterium]|nr:hypothetical protein [Pseudomonadota bacterium]